MRQRLFKKVSILSIFCTLVLLIVNTPVYAATVASESYNMNIGGTQEFDILDKEGNVIHIIISKIASEERIADNTYQITCTSSGSWRAGFKVKVKDNKLVSAYDPFYTTYLGRIEGARLRLSSTKEALYTFNYYPSIIAIPTGVRAYISGTALKTEMI